jgi:hypothetical protein
MVALSIFLFHADLMMAGAWLGFISGEGDADLPPSSIEAALEARKTVCDAMPA